MREAGIIDPTRSRAPLVEGSQELVNPRRVQRRINEPVAFCASQFDCRSNGGHLFAEETREFLSIMGSHGHGIWRLQVLEALQSFVVNI